MNVGKDVFVGETPFPHKFRRLWRYVEILLSARFLLSENDSGKLALFVDVAPGLRRRTSLRLRPVRQENRNAAFI